MRLLYLLLLLPALLGTTAHATGGDPCPGSVDGEKRLLWGDLHVHTAHSMDAWAFGAVATPKEAFAFARGQPLRLVNGAIKTIDRPLDFAAVTDHAETWDLMYLCTDPLYAAQAYCAGLRDLHKRRDSRGIFYDHLLPVLGSAEPREPAACRAGDLNCAAARRAEWRRVQQVANQANEPCAFTALIGYEWTGSPGGRHWHRNVIYGTEVVPPEAYDFVRYPRVQSLWRALAANCGTGCRVLTIPHNLNWADGGRTFAVEDETTSEWALRARFERLAEIFQEKGASECLPEDPARLDADCDFNLVRENAARARLSGDDDTPAAAAWARARSTYYRSLLARGLAGYGSRADAVNPLQLGAIGSTDTHFGTPGRVAEASYDRGISTLLADDAIQLARPDFNPGGLVAVWAAENTRSAVFDALARREAYATSGPRIALRFGAGSADHCRVRPRPALDVPMGGTLRAVGTDGPWFVVEAARDVTLLRSVEIIKGENRDDRLVETVHAVREFRRGRRMLCLTWRDADFDAEAPAYWYARVQEARTPRWSKLLCERADLCDEFPQADTLQSERAWSSPVWWLP
ncbi:MAG: DUF3604 domain-containing protein [Pseudomonadota bacterium]